jgi:transcriptional regulator with XRE-family HTH domain
MSQPHSRISRKLYEAVKLASCPQYEYAHELGLNPATLSQIVNGILVTRVGDARVIRLGELLGVPEVECYELQTEETE